MSSAANRSNFLEVKSFDQCDELVLSILDCIVNQTIGEEDWIVGKFNLADSFADADFEFLLSFNSVSDSVTQLLKARWVDKEEVSFDSLSIDLNSAFHVYFNDWNLSIWLDSVKLGWCGSIEASRGAFPAFHELFVRSHSFELLDTDKVEVVFGFLIVFPDGSGRVGLFACKDIAIVFKDEVDKGALTDTRWANQDKWFVLQRSWIEWVEVFLAEYEHVVLTNRQPDD